MFLETAFQWNYNHFDALLSPILRILGQVILARNLLKIRPSYQVNSCETNRPLDKLVNEADWRLTGDICKDFGDIHFIGATRSIRVASVCPAKRHT